MKKYWNGESRRNGGIASLTAFARNDECCVRNDVPFVNARAFTPPSLRGRSPKQSLTAPRHCEPKGRQVCCREAISSLHIPVDVKCFGGIASPDCYQARNDVVGLQARNDDM